jgi:hypothetical protein
MATGLGDEAVWWCPSLDPTPSGITTLTDLSGNGHDGTLASLVVGDWSSDTRYDGVYLLDVAGGNVISATGAPSDGSLSITAFTVSFWSLFQNTATENGWRFGSSNTSGVRCRFYTQNNGFITFQGGAINVTWAPGTATMSLWSGNLLHFCVRYDGSLTGNDRLKLNINAVPMRLNGTPTIATSFTISDASVELGRTQTITDAAGIHDDFRVFGRAVSDLELTTLARYRGDALAPGGGLLRVGMGGGFNG